MKPLTLLQRQRITLSLFFTVAVGAVFTVATPAFVPWEVVDEKRAQALDQQRRQGKDFHVLETRRRASNQGSDSNSQGDRPETEATTTSINHPSSAPISSQGPLVSLLTDRSNPDALTESTTESTSTVGTDPNLSPEAVQDSNEPIKKRRRRRKRKMVNEGWQELTGRTAREEKEKQHTQTDSTAVSEQPALGENGGLEITWKNKTTP
ncbi:hypothetical protein BC939DRAFT_95179 [Gamsiella multidivaricata]|uniref:uncharacterized protein n=1 Tax=Gamsiella multidivaricata TaxID=101098 RepID=UPI00221F95B8|nr:uncharacterized protein BC939DRAFT_95179 [Gamsiella multidivaricata]KAG0365026.1 hypothetical protein BGZ54_006935 [Gamsiella multidivaricata]KAI7827111.1 hypothetical protein BC939DRAFT_95179 [Gamsiella multidivaricata]